MSQRGEYAQGWKRTEVSRSVAVFLSIVFGIGLLLVPLADCLLGSWREPLREARRGIETITGSFGSGQESWRRATDANHAALRAIRNFETKLEDSSAAAAALRPATLDLLLRFGAAGSEEAYVGNDAWLFYRPDVDPLWTARNSPAVAAQGLARFAADLASRGIRIVFVAVPGKATIHPEKIGAGKFSRPILPAGWENFSRELEPAWREIAPPGAPAPVVVDATRILWQRAMSAGQSQFLQTDSHWTPAAMEAVAAEVAVAVAKMLPLPNEELQTAVSEEKVSGVGDTARMLELPAGSVFLRPESVTVVKTGPEPWRADDKSPVLVLGDSYTNIYSREDLGWGSGAGFAEQISRHLGFAVDRLSRNDAGAMEARRMFAAEASKNPVRFGNKKVLVWQIAMRELINGDWTEVALPGQPSSSGSFVTVPAGEAIEVLAEIRAIGAMPRIGDTPYADFLTAVHLADVREASSGKELDGDALAYVFTMRDRRLLSAADLVAGQEVRARLLNYGENAGLLEQLNRSELDDVELMLQEPNFAEWILPAQP